MAIDFNPFASVLNPLGNLPKTTDPFQASQGFKGKSQSQSSQIASTPVTTPYDYTSAPSPFQAKNAPVITGALSGQGVTTGQAIPTGIQPKTSPVVSSMAGRKNIPSIAGSIIPKANAASETDGTDTLQKFLDDTTIPPENKRAMLTALNENPEEEDSIRQHIQQKYYSVSNASDTLTPSPTTQTDKPEQGVLGGIASKTGQSFMSGMKEIGTAGEELASGKIGYGSAAIRGGSAALTSAFSPITGVLGQGIEEIYNALSPEKQKSLKEKVIPIVQNAKTLYDAESPEQQERLKDIFAASNILLSLVGGKTVAKTGENLLAKGTTEAIPIESKGFVQGLKNVGQKAVQGIERGDQSVSYNIEKGTAGKILPKVAEEAVIKQPAVVGELKKALTPIVRVRDGKIVRSPEKIEKQFDMVVEDIQRRGDMPKDLPTQRDSMERGMKEIYTKHLNPALKASNVKFNGAEVADQIEGKISEFAKDLTPGEYAKAQDFLKTLRSPEYQGMDLEKAEKLKQFTNSITDWGAQGQDNVFNNLLKDAGHATNDMIDAGLGSIEGQGIKEWKNLYGAYSDSLYDVNKAIIKFDRKAPEGLFEGLGKLSGLGDVVMGALKLEPKQMAKGAATIIGGKYLQARNNPNLIIERAFKSASKDKSVSLPIAETPKPIYQGVDAPKQLSAPTEMKQLPPPSVQPKGTGPITTKIADKTNGRIEANKVDVANKGVIKKFEEKNGLTPQSKNTLKSLRIEKKKIQSEKNPLGDYSMKQKFRLIQINDMIREIEKSK